MVCVCVYGVCVCVWCVCVCMVCVCVYGVCVCVFIKLHITAQSGLVILVINSMPLALILPRGDQ